MRIAYFMRGDGRGLRALDTEHGVLASDGFERLDGIGG
jgi:hypothetical protein